MDGNPLIYPPKDVFCKGEEEVLKHFQSHPPPESPPRSANGRDTNADIEAANAVVGSTTNAGVSNSTVDTPEETAEISNHAAIQNTSIADEIIELGQETTEPHVDGNGGIDIDDDDDYIDADDVNEHFVDIDDNITSGQIPHGDPLGATLHSVAVANTASTDDAAFLNALETVGAIPFDSSAAPTADEIMAAMAATTLSGSSPLSVANE